MRTCGCRTKKLIWLWGSVRKVRWVTPPRPLLCSGWGRGSWGCSDLHLFEDDYCLTATCAPKDDDDRDDWSDAALWGASQSSLSVNADATRGRGGGLLSSSTPRPRGAGVRERLGDRRRCVWAQRAFCSVQSRAGVGEALLYTPRVTQLLPQKHQFSPPSLFSFCDSRTQCDDKEFNK